MSLPEKPSATSPSSSADPAQAVVPGALTDGSFSIDIRVYYEDTDAAGVVYYANYLRFMERARSDWLRAITQAQGEDSGSDVFGLMTQSSVRGDTVGDSPITIAAAGPIFVVRRAEVDYGQPARLNDLLRVDVRLDEETRQRGIRGAAFWVSQQVARVDQGAGRASGDSGAQTLVSGRIQLASIDPVSFRPRRLPKWLVERFEGQI